VLAEQMSEKTGGVFIPGSDLKVSVRWRSGDRDVEAQLVGRGEKKFKCARTGEIGRGNWGYAGKRPEDHEGAKMGRFKRD